MIQLFKPIRKSLLSNGKIFGYLKYAIGEIILVVIGILIALQINNWNENQKINQQEQTLLKQLQVDANNNLNEVIELRKRLDINKQGIDSLILNIDNKNKEIFAIPLYLSLSLRKSDFDDARSGYNLMQNGKADLISDEAVLKSVLNIYENDLPDIKDRQNEMNQSINYLQTHFVNKLFTKAPNNLNIQLNDFDVIGADLFQPIDYKSVSENIEFKNTLFQLGKLVESRLAYLVITEEKLKQTISLLDDSIDSK